MATIAAIVASFWLRFDARDLEDRFDALLFLPGFLLYAAAVYWICHLYKGSGDSRRCPTCTISSAPSACWRSRCWCSTIFWSRRSSRRVLLRQDSRSSSTGSSRCSSWAGRASPIAISAIRARASTRWRRDSAPILVLGRAADAEVLLRAIESGAVKKIWPVGILSPSLADQGQSIRGIPCSATSMISKRVVGDLRQRGQPIARSCSRRRRSSRTRDAGSDPDEGAPARPHGEPAAVARGGRRGAAARAGRRSRTCCCGRA